jgi:putative transposase
MERSAAVAWTLCKILCTTGDDLGKSLKGHDVASELRQICLIENSSPERIQCDNGSEFMSKDVDKWAYENGITLDFSRPRKPTDNPNVDRVAGAII